MVSLSELEQSREAIARFPVMKLALRTLSNVRVRNVARIGGALAHGDPQTCTDVDLTCIDGDRAIRMNGEKAIHFTPIERFSEICCLRRPDAGKGRVKCETYDDCAAGSEKVASLHRFLLYLGRAKHGGENARMCCTAAQIPGKCLFHHILNRTAISGVSNYCSFAGLR